MKVNVISLSYIFQVLYVLCFSRPRYQVSVYRTIGPLVFKCKSCSIFHRRVHVMNSVVNAFSLRLLSPLPSMHVASILLFVRLMRRFQVTGALYKINARFAPHHANMSVQCTPPNTPLLYCKTGIPFLNVDRVYSLEPLHRGGSNAYLRYLF